MDRLASVERHLRAAAPHALLDAVRTVLTDLYGSLAVDLLLADYAMTILQPVGAPPRTFRPVSARTGAPGRAFGAQEPFPCADASPGSVIAHLPVTVRGDRLGVLCVTLPEERYDTDVLAELAEAAQALGHQIVVAERDTDLYLRARRAERLTLAAEIQWGLLPGRACAGAEYELGAQLEPAYAIHRDNFDWSASDDHLTLALTHGMGEGIDAAQLTGLAINALRNARRAGLSLADQACMADQAIYGQHRGALHVSVLLLRIHLPTGEAEIVATGSPRVRRLRDGAVEAVQLDAQLPPGMFEDSVYTAQSWQVRPGDRLLFLSDGVYDATSPAGERYGEQALARAVQSTRLLPPSQVPRAVLHELAGHRGESVAVDDAMVVCLDWHGRARTE
ncbi:PP2C family protein-serine/threonine phosphatase [Streptomyces sp. NPDC054863]